MASRTHSYAARLAHWLFAISGMVLGASGVEILRAFPSFDAKLPHPFVIPVPVPGLGGWLGGALDWHLTFAWLFALAVVLYTFDLAAGGWRRLRLNGEGVRGIWPMMRYYFLRGPKPAVTELYNPLQKSAYWVAAAALGGALLTGAMLSLPVQLAMFVEALGGWQSVRMLHFACFVVLAGFLPGHLLMVALAGWSAMRTMLTGFIHDTPGPASDRSSR